MRLGQRHQVPDGPGDDIAVSLQIALAPFISPEHTGNVTGDRRLFGQNRDGTGFTRLHSDSQSTAILGRRRVPFPAPCVGCNVAHRVFLPSANRGVPHISLVFRETWDATNLNLSSDIQKEARGALWYPTSREKRARYGAPHDSRKGQRQNGWWAKGSIRSPSPLRPT